MAMAIWWLFSSSQDVRGSSLPLTSNRMACGLLAICQKAQHVSRTKNRRETRTAMLRKGAASLKKARNTKHNNE